MSSPIVHKIKLCWKRLSCFKNDAKAPWKYIPTKFPHTKLSFGFRRLRI